MQRRLYSYLEKYNLLNANHFGLREKHCTIDALVELTKKVRRGSNRLFKISVLFDLKKALDTLDHSILLEKLEAHRVRGIANKWIECYLLNRQRFVEGNIHASDWTNIAAGFPQGSVLGPIFFLLYMNDIAKALLFWQVYLLADDNNITSVCSSSARSQIHLSDICDWFLSNEISVNVDKSSLVNWNRRMSASTMQVELNESLFDYCNSSGVLLDGNMKFLWKFQIYKVHTCQVFRRDI